MEEENKHPGIENLKPFNTLTVEEQREIASKGGKASVEARREKKVMSQLYAEFLEKEHEITLEDKTTEKLSGSQLLGRVMSKVLDRGDSASVSLMKEIREATEGQKINLDLISPLQIIIEGVEPESDNNPD